MPGPLNGIRIVDLSKHLAGPYCSLLFADMGAEVIRVDPVGGDEDRRIGPITPAGDSYGYVARHGGKKDITLNLRSQTGIEILHKLVKVSDVLLENFTLRDKTAFGLNYAALGAINPRIVVASISAFGKTGPDANKPGLDPIAQAASGMMSITGFPSNPPTRAAAGICDFGGALHCAFGIMVALWHRSQTGKGQEVDVSLLDSAVSLMAQHGIFAEYHGTGIERKAIGNRSPFVFADTFKAKDGWVFISVARSRIWKRFCTTIDRPDLIEDPRLKTDWDRAKNGDVISAVIVPWAAQRSCAEISRLLEKAQVPCGIVCTVATAANHPQTRSRQMLYEQDYPKYGKVMVSGRVTKLSGISEDKNVGAPLLGEHNEDIYCGLLHFSREDLKGFKSEGII